MLAVHIRLLHGHLRTGSADDLAMTADGDPGEWPPSPARVVAALVAADGTRDRCRLTTGAELALFERAHPPIIHASAPAQVLRTRLSGRYVIVNATDRGSVQDYPARKPQAIAPGTRLSPIDPRLTYVWSDVDPTPDELTSLRLRAARIGYVGCADSPAQVDVSTSLDSSRTPGHTWEPDRGGMHVLPVPTRGFIDLLDRAFDAWTAGQPVRRSWHPPQRVAYRAPDDPRRDLESIWPHVIWLRFGHALPGRSALRVAETLKSAVIDLYARFVGASPTDVPDELHGHHTGDVGAAYQHAQWLVLPDAGFEYARGDLYGAAIMLPRVRPETLEGIRHVILRLREVAVPGLPIVSVQPHGGEPRPWSANPDRWLGPSRLWASVLPVVHERRARHGPSLDDIAMWCVHAGFERPTRAWTSQVPFVRGAVALKPHEVFRDRPGVRRPYSHIRLEFERPVTGPIVIGRARQYGMGLMAPIGDQDHA